MKTNHTGRPSGIPLGKLRVLPVNWMVFLTIAFYLMFASAVSVASGHNLPDKSCVADTAMQIELA